VRAGHGINQLHRTDHFFDLRLRDHPWPEKQRHAANQR
jgi:hypothetical protein